MQIYANLGRKKEKSRENLQFYNFSVLIEFFCKLQKKQ